MDIQITTKKSAGVERLLAVTVPAADVKAMENTTAKRYASSVRLPGFRPGKAPPAMVKKKYKDAIRQEVDRVAGPGSVQAGASTARQLKVASQPHVHDLKFDEGEPLTLRAACRGAARRSSSPALQGFTVTRRAADGDRRRRCDEQIEQLRDQRATWTPVTEQAAPG